MVDCKEKCVDQKVGNIQVTGRRCRTLRIRNADERHNFITSFRTPLVSPVDFMKGKDAVSNAFSCLFAPLSSNKLNIFMESEQYLMRMIWQRCAPNVMIVVTLMCAILYLLFIDEQHFWKMFADRFFPSLFDIYSRTKQFIRSAVTLYD